MLDRVTEVLLSLVCRVLLTLEALGTKMAAVAKETEAAQSLGQKWIQMTLRSICGCGVVLRLLVTLLISRPINLSE